MRLFSKGYTINSSKLTKLEIPLNSYEDINHQLIHEIVSSNKPLDIYDLADKLYISITTLLKSIKDLNTILDKNHIFIQIKKNLLFTSGSEQNKRKLISTMILEESKKNYKKYDILKSFFPNIDMSDIKQTILNSINKYDCFIEEIYLENLAVNISVALHRIIDNHQITKTTIAEKQSRKVEYLIAQDICKTLQPKLIIYPNNNEIYEISKLLIGQIRKKKSRPVNTTDATTVECTSKFINTISLFLNNTFHYFNLDINYDDRLENFSLHIKNMVDRLKVGQSTENYLIDNIKKNSPFIYDVSINIAKQISEYFDVEIPESEIALISIHVGLLIENADIFSNKLTVAVLTDDYKHLNTMIVDKIQKAFSAVVNVITINESHFKSINSLNVDIIVTTTTYYTPRIKTIVISPFFSDNDFMTINNAINIAIKEKELKKYNYLLNSLFSDKLYFYNIDNFNNKFEIIRFLCQKAIDFGLVEPNFTESVIKRELVSSTSFFNSFAIPHGLELNAKKTMFVCLVEKNGILWDENKINIILLITVKQSDRKSFMKIYNGIVRQMQDPIKVKRLAACANLNDFLTALKNYN